MSSMPKICQRAITFDTVQFRPQQSLCPQCGEEAPWLWDARRIALDLATEGPGILDVRLGVYRCPSCHRYFRALPPFLSPNATYTNRVMATAVASVFEDGMAIRRVPQRLARDYLIRPSEATIRRWCRIYARALDLEQSYMPWLVSSFSGILCVDELYQNNLALVLAVEPQEERLVGYLLKHGSVNAGDIEDFLQRLEEQGLSPQQVVTDGSALYPEVIARVWPEAAHQLCLFHQTRLVLRAVRKTLLQIPKTLPEPPRQENRKSGRLPLSTKTDARKRARRIAIVLKLRQQGMAIRAIARHTGHNVNTVRRWLRGTVRMPEQIPEVSKEELLLPTPFEKEESGTLPEKEESPPSPWSSWEEVETARQEFKELKFKLMARTSSLSPEEQERVSELLAGPLGERLSDIYRFTQKWYAIWWDEKGERQDKEQARKHFEQWRHFEEAKEYPLLAQLQRRWDEGVFEELSHFLENEEWEGTSNAAERKARHVRQLQSPHFNWRNDEMLEGALKASAILQMQRLTENGQNKPAFSRRGRPSMKTHTEPLLRL